MRKNVVKKFSGRSGKQGYTLMELLVAVAIIAILCAIVMIPAGTIIRNMQFQQKNDYAKTIFMAAQTNLSKMRKDGTLVLLQGETDSLEIPTGLAASTELSDEYVYTASSLTASFAYVLPNQSVEDALRSNQVIIEYNPVTGNVFSVFYSEGDDLLSYYRNTDDPRSEENRKPEMVGYYQGSALSSTDMNKVTMTETAVKLSFTNGHEGILNVEITAPEVFWNNMDGFKSGLDVTLSLTGETSGKRVELPLMSGGTLSAGSCTKKSDGITWQLSYTLDSLKDGGSFAGFCAGGTALNRISSETLFTSLLPGENITVKAVAEYTGTDVAVTIDQGILTGVNPMFGYLEPGISDGKYILAIGNGRNLQNLNALAPSVADKIETVVLSGDIDWQNTVDYYGAAYSNAASEAPARALPYFVPVDHEALLGSGGADVAGNGCTVKNLKIDSSKYSASTSPYFVNGEAPSYAFSGLFADVNTNINNLNISDSTVSGATLGALAGQLSGGELVGCGISSTTLNGSACVGGLVGQMDSGSLSQCTVASTEISGSGTYMGGLVGKAAAGTLESSSTSAITVDISGAAYAGGLVGENSATLSGCTAAGGITANATANAVVGGLVGVNKANISGGSSASVNITHESTGTQTSTAILGGLVGRLDSGALSGLTVSPQIVGGNAAYVGGLVGKTVGGSLSGCTVTNAVVDVLNPSYVGGLVGENAVAVDSCTATADITYKPSRSNSAAIGGFVGISSTGEIKDSTATATVTQGTTTTTTATVGGFVGRLNSGTLTANQTTATVDTKYITHVGGFVGYVAAGKLDTCKITGTTAVTGGKSTNVGGFVGSATDGVLTGCEMTDTAVTVTGATNVGGFVGDAAGSGITACKITGTTTVTGGTSTNVGGFAGQTVGLLQNSSITATEVTTTTATNVGGFVGKLIGDSLSNCDIVGTTKVTGGTSTNVGGLVGLASGGTAQNCDVSATTVTVTKATNLGGVVGSASGSGFTTCKITGSTTVTGGSSASVGGFAGKLAGGTLSDCDITGTTEVTCTGATYVGGLVGQAAAGTLKNCDIASTTVDAGSSTNVGGLVGENSITVSSCTTASTTTVKAVNPSYIGGLVAVAKGQISSCTAATTINYSPSGTASSVIGGFVGQVSSGGSFSGTQAITGAINLETAPTGKSYIVGGVIGKDAVTTATTYSGITSTVTVDADFKGATHIAGTVDPSKGNGPVGMFVGYVNNETFTNCSSTAANSTFQFLGEISCTEATLSGDNWFSSSQKNDVTGVTMGTDDTIWSLAPGNGFTALSNGYGYVASYDADLTDCTFVHNSTTYTQTFGSDYFFLGSEYGEEGGGQRLKPATVEYEKPSGLTYAHLSVTVASVTGYTSDYYYRVATGAKDANGNPVYEYYPILIDQTYSTTTRQYSNVTAYYINSSGKKVQLGVLLNDDGEPTGSTLQKAIDFDAYTRILTGELVITDLDCKYALSSSAGALGVVALTLDEDMNLSEDLARTAVWTISDTLQWINQGNTKTYYLCPYNAKLVHTTSTYVSYILGRAVKVIPDEDDATKFLLRQWYSSANSYYYIGWNSSTTAFVRVSKTATVPTNGYLRIWELAGGSASVKCAEYLYQNIEAQPCVAVDANGNLLVS